jgi:hypothetical protein
MSSLSRGRVGRRSRKRTDGAFNNKAFDPNGVADDTNLGI